MTKYEVEIDKIIKRLNFLYSYSDKDNKTICKLDTDPLEWFRGECVAYLEDCINTGRTKKIYEDEIGAKVEGFAVGICGNARDEKQVKEIKTAVRKLFYKAIKDTVNN
jgi:hypothetical protein